MALIALYLGKHEISSFITSNPIFSAISVSLIGGILLFYIKEYIQSEHKRFNKIVLLERISHYNMNAFAGNLKIISGILERGTPINECPIFNKPLTLRVEEISNVKFLKFASDASHMLFMSTGYNDLLVEQKDYAIRLISKNVTAQEFEVFVKLANKGLTNQFNFLKTKTEELAQFSREVYSKATVLAKEEKPLLVSLACWTTWLRKLGKEIIGEDTVSNIIDLLKHQDKKDCNRFSKADENCSDCIKKEFCEKYYNSRF